MRDLLFRLSVALFTLTIGLMLSSILSNRRVRQRLTCSVPPLVPAQLVATSKDEEEYPETLGLQPYEIEWFIDNHPSANLGRLWQRLSVKSSHPEASGDFTCYDRCTAEIFYYDLDKEPGDEILLRVGDEHAQNWRYLVFKLIPNYGWTPLGSIDVLDRYEPARHIVLLNEGKPYLILTQQAVTGSGIALYENHIYQVKQKRHSRTHILSRQWLYVWRG
ncbi:MAG TPA: hypothetical protein VGQ39_02595 [Pyrinomonadaceae bacterium]|nr:hypothetical protein [Pyrinomonadaceae bacterium]